MRDWTRTLRRASFRGVRFWVEDGGPDVGRRVAVHEVSGGEAPLTEDMGRRASSVGLSVYLVSDRADAEGLALEAACAAPGASLLMLPTDAGRIVHCVGCHRSWNKDRLGYVAYDLAFVEAGFGGGGLAGGIGALRITFGTGLAAAALAFEAL